MPENYYILMGGAEHLPFFERNAAFQKQQWFWTVPKGAQIGDIGFVYLCAPVSRIVGHIELTKEPFYNIGMFPQWENNWMAEISKVKFFEPAESLTIKGLKPLFPDWGWLRYPRGKTKIPSHVIGAFLELMGVD